MAAAIPIAMQGTGMVLNAIGAVKEAEAKAKQAEFDAQNYDSQAGMSLENADLVMHQSAEMERRSRFGSQLKLGSIRAAYGASGVTMQGTAQAYTDMQNTIAEENAMSIRMQGYLQAKAYRRQADIYKQNAQNLRAGKGDIMSAGYLNAGAATVTGAYGMYKDWVADGRSGKTVSDRLGVSVGGDWNDEFELTRSGP